MHRTSRFAMVFISVSLGTSVLLTTACSSIVTASRRVPSCAGVMGGGSSVSCRQRQRELRQLGRELDRVAKSTATPEDRRKELMRIAKEAGGLNGSYLSGEAILELAELEEQEGNMADAHTAYVLAALAVSKVNPGALKPRFVAGANRVYEAAEIERAAKKKEEQALAAERSEDRRRRAKEQERQRAAKRAEDQRRRAAAQKQAASAPRAARHTAPSGSAPVDVLLAKLLRDDALARCPTIANQLVALGPGAIPRIEQWVAGNNAERRRLQTSANEIAAMTGSVYPTDAYGRRTGPSVADRKVKPLFDQMSRLDTGSMCARKALARMR